MISKLIRLGIETILKTICEKIKIQNINIVNINDKYRGKIYKLYIKAESIIYNKINISNVNINIRNLIIRLKFNKKILVIDNCNASIFMKLSNSNINETLGDKKWNKLKTSIESFISMSFRSIVINNKSIYFISANGDIQKENVYTLDYDKNTISLVNNINQEKLSILNDKNIIINNLNFSEDYIELKLFTKVIFN